MDVTQQAAKTGQDLRMNKEHLELYTDYLLGTFCKTTAAGLSALVDGQVSHDQVTRFLSCDEYTSKELWQDVKPTVRKVECEDTVLIFLMTPFKKSPNR
jgi:hypothetical protein